MKRFGLRPNHPQRRLLRPVFLAPGLTLGVVWAGLGLLLAPTAVRGEQPDAQGTTIAGVLGAFRRSTSRLGAAAAECEVVAGVG